MLANPDLPLERSALKSRKITREQNVPGPRPAFPVTPWRRALRFHQWTKNLLVFLPLLLAHSFHLAMRPW